MQLMQWYNGANSAYDAMMQMLQWRSEFDDANGEMLLIDKDAIGD